MQMKTNGAIMAWRISLAVIAANIVFSVLAEIFIDDIQISSLVSTLMFTMFALALFLFDGRHDIGNAPAEAGFKGFDVKLLFFLIFIPVASQIFCAFSILPIKLMLQMLFGSEMKEEILKPNNMRELITAAVYLCILAPISEEIVFRGVVYKHFERHSTYSAIFLSALSFSAAHLDIRSFVQIFFIGLSLSLIRFATGSIFATMIGHAAVNAYSLCMMMAGDNNMIYVPTIIVLGVGFPFALWFFMKKAKFPDIHRAECRHGFSVCLALLIVIYMAFQGIMLVANMEEWIEDGSDKIYDYFGDDFLPRSDGIDSYFDFH